MLTITKVSETATTITLGWTPIPCLGYVLYVDDVRKSNSWDPNKNTWKVSKGAAKYKIVALGAEDEGVYPSVTPTPDPGGRGVKLPPWPSVYQNQPSQVMNVSPTPQDSYKMWQLNNVSDRVIKFPAGATLAAWPRFENINRCIIDFNGSKLVDMFYGMFFAGSCSDLWVKGFEISGTQVQGVLISADMTRAWFDGTLRDNKPNRQAQPGQQNHHGYYIGSGKRQEHIVVTGKILRHTGGYGVQLYDDYGVSGAGCHNSVFTGISMEDGVGDPTWEGNSTLIWATTASGITLVNTVGRRNGRQLAVCQPEYSGQLSLKNCADLQRTMGDGSWGVPSKISGAPSGDASQAGDIGYRMPYDTRTSGIGAP